MDKAGEMNRFDESLLWSLRRVVNLHGHDLCPTFRSRCTMAGVDLRTLQQLLITSFHLISYLLHRGERGVSSRLSDLSASASAEYVRGHQKRDSVLKCIAPLRQDFARFDCLSIQDVIMKHCCYDLQIGTVQFALLSDSNTVAPGISAKPECD
jgi:hypothetical protein